MQQESRPISSPLLSFYGREAETAALDQMLADPACRLVTLVGPGGMGKTRLAGHVAESSAQRFADGAYWVNLQPLQSERLLLPTLMEALGLALSGDPMTQLTHALRHKQLLLALDNFEHLLDAAPLLSALLEAAPGLKILVTSREALQMREEWVHHLDGLPYPPSADVENLSAYPAVELFVTAARRAASSFDPDTQWEAIVRICRHVAGMPLALELAAAWTRTLTCAEIAAEIGRGLDLFTTEFRNIPERQRSMTLIFDQTCAMLTAEQFDAFKRLSVFRGGFSRHAAAAVVGASLPVLAAFIDKALLNHDPNGRYTMHRLIAQYAAERLAESPDEADVLASQHGAYYTAFLHQWSDALMGGDQQAAITAIRLDLNNIRRAWSWATQSASVDAIQQGASAFAQFCQIQSRLQEAADLFEQAAYSLNALEQTPQVERTLVLIQAYLAGFYLRVGRLSDAETLAEVCLKSYKRLEIPPLPGFNTDPLFTLGVLALTQGRYAVALEYGDHIRHISEHHTHPFNHYLACYLMTEAAFGLGDYEAARRHGHQTLDLLTAMDNRWSMAYTYNQLGRIERALANYEAAQGYFQHSLAIREAFEDRAGIAQASNLLGENALMRGHYEEAQGYLERSLQLYRGLGDQGALARVLNSSALRAIYTHDLHATRPLLHEALEIAARIDFTAVLLYVLLTTVEYLFAIGQRETGVDLLALVAAHPSANQETLDIVQKITARHDLSLPLEAAQTDLTTMTAHLLHAFPDVPADDSPHPRPTPQPHQNLIEPLTVREQEVLHYIAEGLSNRQIAQKMVVSLSTVKSHINSLYGKLGVTTRDEAMQQARASNLL